MIIKTPIHCPHCNTIAGYQEDYMFYVMEHDLLCPQCGEVVIRMNKIMC